MAEKYHNTKPVTPDMFWSRVRRGDPTECWEYVGFVGKNGYCEVCFERKRTYAHRIAYMLTFPEWDGRDFVLHHCDNRRCVNPAHLFHGSQQDNVDDMVNKGRARGARGETNPAAKLTATQVLEIRASPLGYRRLARLYPMVSRSTILHIRNGRKWKHL